MLLLVVTPIQGDLAILPLQQVQKLPSLIVGKKPPKNPLESVLNQEFITLINETPIWYFETERGVDLLSGEVCTGVSYGAPIICDIDNDDRSEIIVTSLDFNLYALDAETGVEKWPSPFSANYFLDSWISVGDIDNDGLLEIIIDDSSEGHTHKLKSTLYVIDGESGHLSWEKEFEPTQDLGFSVLGDLDGDPNLEIVIGRDDHLYALNGEDGQELWNFPEINVSQPAILSDIDNDNKLEVIVGASNYLYALNGEDGSELWKYPLENPVSSSPVLGDLNRDGKMEIIVCAWDKMYVLEITESEVHDFWPTPFEVSSDGISSPPCLADVNYDNILDIIVCDYWEIFALSGTTGEEIWNDPFNIKSEDFGQRGAQYLSTPCIGDIDNDNRLEIIQGCNDGFFALEAETGALLWTFPLWARVTASPLLHDIDNDSLVELIVCCDASVTQEQDSKFKTVFVFDFTNGGHRIYWNGIYGTPSPHKCSPNILESVDSDLDFLSTFSEKYYGTNVSLNDTDFDGILDGWEVTLGLDPLDPNDSSMDSDGDGLTNLEEFYSATNPFNSDTDGDNLPDDWEVEQDTNPRVKDHDKDPDQDNSYNFQEYNYGTDPFNPDTDGDSLPDGDEFLVHNTDPSNDDTDGDTLDDGWEVYVGFDPTVHNREDDDTDKDGLLDRDEYRLYHTHPNKSDTDDDTLPDYDEVITYFTNASNPDTDFDGMLDGWEINFELNPKDATDASLDPDNDGLTNLEECEWFIERGSYLDPTNYDTDGDGLSDGTEVLEVFGDCSTNPTINDTDMDNILDGDEINLNLNPCDNDTDDDGFSDGEELGCFLCNPNNPWLNPDTPYFISIVGFTLVGIFILISASYRFIYVPRRVTFKDWWRRRVLRLHQREEDVIEYAGKARKILKDYEGGVEKK
jgi:outer membrane protein assembly factor BamB